MAVTQTVLKICIFGIAISGMLGCAKSGFQPVEVSSITGNDGQGGQGPIDPALEDLPFKGVVSQGNNKGQVLLEIDKESEAVHLIVPLPTEVLTGIGGALPELKFKDLPGAKLFVRADGKVVASVPIKYIVRKTSFKKEGYDNKLPSGDALPAFPAGEGARFGLEIDKKHRVHLYVGKEAAAVFVETPEVDSLLNCGNLPICPTPVIGPFAAIDETTRQRVGYIAYTLARPNNIHSGLYVTVRFPEDLARFLDDHVRY